jgi:hypothetical protein
MGSVRQGFIGVGGKQRSALDTQNIADFHGVSSRRLDGALRR